jgi:SEC-C motif-containing protein
MRSRYSAYALNLPDYIIRTTHPKNPGYSKNKASWRKEIQNFSNSTLFLKLEILEFLPNEQQSTVTFKATLIQNGKDISFIEKSFFKKLNSKWFYFNSG